MEDSIAPEEIRGRIVIAGGSGFLGLNLARHLAAEDREIVLISRRGVATTGREAEHTFTQQSWDARTLGDWVESLDGCRALVNLAGRSVDCIKTPDHYDEILRARVESTRILGKALRTVSRPPPVWIQMSTAHRYGDPPDLVCNEDSSFGYGMAPTVGQAWEEAFEESLLSRMRGVVLRTSFVVGRSGGALPRLSKLVRIGLGGKIGHGRQGISWIHEHDLNCLFERAISNPDMVGAYLATAPNPVSNREFMAELRRVHRMPIGLPAMAWMVKIGAPLFMRTDPELAIYGRFCVSKRLEKEGFEFRYPKLRDALVSLYL